MCGIFGIFNFSGSKESLHHLGQAMLKTIHHRGPDDQGLEILPIGENWLAFGHTRLSILDLSPAGHQPMWAQGQQQVLTYNGEIYNFQELRAELLQQGYQFHSQTDSEVILATYQLWGLEGFKRFNGMWALAIWDSAKQELILSRDRLGVKPLYYAWQGQTLIFSSEIKTVLEYPNFPRRLNPEGLSDYLSYRYVLDNQTFFKDIQALEPGCHLLLKGTETKKIPFWELPIIPHKDDPGEAQILEQTRHYFEQAIRYRMIADVPLGAYLSGGLDSSLVVAQMAQFSPHPVKTFTIGFPEEGFNEFAYARQVADYYSTEHHEIVLEGQDFINLLPQVIHQKDAPLSVPNEVALYVLSQELKKHISVVLSGEGADELFGGYGRIFRSAFDYQRLKGQVPLSSEQFTQLKQSLQQKYKTLNWPALVDHFLEQYSYIPLQDKQALLTQQPLQGDWLNQGFFQKHFGTLTELDPQEQYMWIFQKFHLLGLLGRLDANTMSSAVEGRVPFVDYQLVEYINQVPLKYRMTWKSEADRQTALTLNSNGISEKLDITKYLLRQLSQTLLPQSIIQRPKVGFPVPLNQWFGGQFRSYAQELLLSSSAKTKDILNPTLIQHWLSQELNEKQGLTIWMLVNLELWMQQYRVGIA